MNSTGRKRTGWKLAWLALAVGAFLLFPAAAQAQCSLGSAQVNGYLIGILNETMESAPGHAAPGGTGPLAAGSYPTGLDVRLAQATEVGQLGMGCGSLASLAGELTVHAQSRIVVRLDPDGAVVMNPVSGAPDLTAGPIKGTFTIKTAAGNVSGKLEGVLDFRLTNWGVTECGGFPCPVVTAEGVWTMDGSSRKGGFQGVALVPFQNPQLGSGWFYLDVTGLLTGTPKAPAPLQDSDYDQQFGAPQAKFIITLFE